MLRLQSFPIFKFGRGDDVPFSILPGGYRSRFPRKESSFPKIEDSSPLDEFCLCHTKASLPLFLVLAVRHNGDHRFSTILLPCGGIGWGLGIWEYLPPSSSVSFLCLFPSFLVLVVRLNGDRHFFTILLPGGGIGWGFGVFGETFPLFFGVLLCMFFPFFLALAVRLNGGRRLFTILLPSDGVGRGLGYL